MKVLEVEQGAARLLAGLQAKPQLDSRRHVQAPVSTGAAEINSLCRYLDYCVYQASLDAPPRSHAAVPGLRYSTLWAALCRCAKACASPAASLAGRVGSAAPSARQSAGEHPPYKSRSHGRGGIAATAGHQLGRGPGARLAGDGAGTQRQP